ncbi:MAG: PAS domain S-box protein, partial [Planctomycetes bacterium]|nr:PAS domain S-box protein [Planctomycetota bacterium]
EKQQAARGMIVGVPALAGPEIRWLLVNSLPLPQIPGVGPNAQKARLVTTFADITEQVLAHDSLRTARDKYQNLIETLPFMLVQRDKDFKITYMNPAALQMTGHGVDDFMRPGFCECILHPDDLPAYFAAAQTVAQGQSARIEVRFFAKDGTLKTVLAFFHPTWDHGKLVGSTSLVLDITMQRLLEEELVNARRLELVGRLASGIVHDFNNLLMILMGFAGCAKNELTPDHPAWPYLCQIEDAGEQAAHLSGQLLTFSKQRPKQRVGVDLNAVVAQTARLAKSSIPTNVSLDVNLAETLPIVIGDENQFKQVVMNLILNARDAMPSGGQLTIRTDNSPPAGANGSPWAHLSIQDTGCGMSEDIRTRVFQPFFSTKENGTGLGLAIVHQIIDEAGGAIAVWSQLDQGTRFDIWLPAAISSEPEA